MAEPSTIILATCRKAPELTADDDLLRRALEARGVRVRALPWDSVEPDGRPPSLVCLRSTWDYHRRWPEFRRWIQRFASPPDLLWNPAATVLWNADKTYLRELGDAGVRLPATRWYEPGERPDSDAFLRLQGLGRAVLKPRISATAYGTYLLEPGAGPNEDEWAHLEEVGSLIQAFVPEIAAGESSLMFVEGAFSHAVRKLPVGGEFRVQRDFGGRVEPIAASAPLRDFADRVLASVSLPWVYARVDAVETARGPTLMELELIEPDLFLTQAPAAAGRLADALLARASGT